MWQIYLRAYFSVNSFIFDSWVKSSFTTSFRHLSLPLRVDFTHHQRIQDFILRHAMGIFWLNDQFVRQESDHHCLLSKACLMTKSNNCGSCFCLISVHLKLMRHMKMPWHHHNVSGGKEEDFFRNFKRIIDH